MSQNSPASTYHYTECAVAYLDIIGFKDRISRSSADEGIIKGIAEAFSEVEEWLNTFRGDAPHVHTYMFSDSIVISSSDTTDSSLMTLIAGVSMLQCALVAHRFLVTGGIATGLLYEAGAIMFGPAMVEAYRSERLARWPRVVVAPSTLQRLRVHLPPRGGSPYFLCREDDGLTYVDYLAQGCLIGTAHPWAKQYSGESLSISPDDLLASQLHYHKDSILSSSSCDPTVNLDTLPKCHALAFYHNKTIRRLRSSLSPDSQPNPDLDYLQSAAQRMTRSAEGTASETVAQFIIEKLAMLRAASGRLGQYLMDLPLTFPAMYGLPSNK